MIFICIKVFMKVKFYLTAVFNLKTGKCIKPDGFSSVIDNTDLHLAASFYTNEGDKNITNLTLSREKKQHQKSAA